MRGEWNHRGASGVISVPSASLPPSPSADLRKLAAALIGSGPHTALMDDALAWLAAFAVATVMGIIVVVMILASRVGGWLRTRWTRRRLRSNARQGDQP